MAVQNQDLFQLPPGITGDALVRQLNRHLRTIAVQLARLGTTATDAGGARLQNVGRARADTDAVTRRDLLDYAIFAPEGEVAVAQRGIVARGGVRVPKYARDQDEVVTLGQLHQVMDDEGGGPAGPPGPTGPAGPPGPAGTPVEDAPAGTRPGTVFALAATYSVLLVRHNYLWLARVGVAPGVNEFTLSGVTLTTGDTIDVTDDLYALGWP